MNETTSATSLVAMTFPADMIVPAATTAEEFDRQTALITRRATDLVSCPIVMEGYQMGGKPKEMAFVNMATMATKRIKAHFPLMNPRDPVMQRLIAQAKYLVAGCLKLKYECRAERKPYDHLKDCTVQINKLIDAFYEKYKAEVKEIVSHG